MASSYKAREAIAARPPPGDDAEVVLPGLATTLEPPRTQSSRPPAGPAPRLSTRALVIGFAIIVVAGVATGAFFALVFP